MTLKISLVIPGLCGPLPEFDENHPAARLFVDTFEQFRKQDMPDRSFAEQACDLFGISCGSRVPDAALALRGYGIEPGSSCWVHADPVHLEADMDSAILTDSQVLNLRMNESEQLVAELNRHFAEDGLCLLLADENNWFIKLEDCHLVTTPLNEAVGRNINYLLPEGEQASYWKRVLNEMQMLLHMSDINAAREQAGHSMINSVWLWGEGVMPGRGKTDISQVWTDDAMVKGLAGLNEIPLAPLPDCEAITSQVNDKGHLLVVLKHLYGPCNYGDAGAWLDELADIVDAWMQPLIDYAREHGAELVVYPCNGSRYRLVKSRIVKSIISKFWNKARLRDYVET